MTQLSMMAAIDAALTTGFPCGSWWWPAWKAGDAIPPGWRPPVPGADCPKPRLPAGSPPGTACENDEIDMEIAKAIDAWLPDGMEVPFIGIHETRRLACGGAWARLEACDGGLCHATVRDRIIEWGRVPGAGALVALEGRWTRLPAEEAWDEEAQDWKPVTTDEDDVAEEPDVDPVYGTRRVPQASPDFLEKLLQQHEAVRRARHERWKPLEALEEAGLATIQRQGERGTKSFQCHIALAPAVSDAMTLWFFQAGGYPENVTLLLAPDTDPDSEIVRSVTAILGLGVTVRPAESPRPATGGAV